MKHKTDTRGTESCWKDLQTFHCATSRLLTCHGHRISTPCDIRHTSSQPDTHPLAAKWPTTASTAVYILRALCLRALPPRAYLLTHVRPSCFSSLMRGVRALLYTSCTRGGGTGQHEGVCGGGGWGAAEGQEQHDGACQPPCCRTNLLS